MDATISFRQRSELIVLKISEALHHSLSLHALMIPWNITIERAT